MSAERTLTVLPRTGRLVILLGLVVVGLGISGYVPLPAPVLAFRPPGALSMLSIILTPARQVSLVVTLLACAVVDGIMQDHKRLAGSGLTGTMPFWVLPALLILAAFSLFEGLVGPLQRVLGLAAAALGVGLVVIAQLHTLDARDPWFGLARLGLNAVAYGLALTTYILVHILPSRGMVAVPLIAAISTLLALELFAGPRPRNRRRWGSAALVGLMMAEGAWVLGPGVVPPLVAGFLLLVVFYALTGILQQHFWGRLRRHVVIEFLAVAAVALAVLLSLAR